MTVYVNQHSSGGVEQPDIDDILTCQALCIAVENCLGFDSNLSSCWLHFDKDDFLPANTYNTGGLLQFKFTRGLCPLTTSATTRATTATTTHVCYLTHINPKILNGGGKMKMKILSLVFYVLDNRSNNCR